MRTYKFRIRPSTSQIKTLWEHSLCLNRLYNRFIELEQESYKTDNKFISYYDLNAIIVEMKLSGQLCSTIHSQVLQQVAYRVARSYQLFFKHVTIHPPSFRSCRNFFNITYPQSGYSIRGSVLHTKVYGNIPIVLHRNIQGNIKQVSITNDTTGWYLCVYTDYSQVKQRSNTRVAIDLGTTKIYTTETGEFVKAPSHQKYYDKQIDNLKSRRDTTCKKGSRRFKYLSRTIKKLYSVKTRKTNDVLHKVSKDLSRKFDTVFVEDLSVKQMSESKATGRNRMVRNSCMSRFLDMLKYKMNQVIEVNPKDTSQTCSYCHHKLDKKLPLHNRTFVCPHCGLTIDRDHNAAVNILQLGLAKCSKVYKKDISIQDLPILIWIDEDIRKCLEQAIVPRDCVLA